MLVCYSFVLSFFRCRKLSRRLAFDPVRDGGHLCVVAVGGDEVRCAWGVVCLESGWRDTLQHTATHCNTLRRSATHCNALRRTATHKRELQRRQTHCNTLQRTQQHTALHRGEHASFARVATLATRRMGVAARRMVRRG